MGTRSQFSFPLFDPSGWKSPPQHVHIYPNFWSRSLLYITLPCIPIPEPLHWFVRLPFMINSLTPLTAGGHNVPSLLSYLAEPRHSPPSTSATICLQPFHPHLFQSGTRLGASTPRVTLLQPARHRRFRIRPESPVLLRGGLRVVPTVEHARFGLGGKGDS